MKYLILSFIVSLSFFNSTSQAAEASKEVFWQDVRSLVIQCAVQPVAYAEGGQKTYGQLQSRCKEIWVRGQMAVVKLNGSTLIATLSESRNADGGDLNDIEVRDLNGTLVATRSDTPAFGDVLLALAGNVKGLEVIQEEIESTP